MTNSKLLATAFAVAALSFTSALAADAPTGMEKCKVVNAEGKNLILENKADGVGDSAVAHQNKAGDEGAWIYVPTGECDKINHGDVSGVDTEIQGKIDLSTMGA